MSIPITTFLSAASSDTKEEGLEAQINRLAELIGRLENKVGGFKHVLFGLTSISDCQTVKTQPARVQAMQYFFMFVSFISSQLLLQYLLLVRNEMTVSQKHLGEFCGSLKQYLKIVAGERECFHITAVRLPDGVTFIVYEFWETEDDWKRHLQSPSCKSFQHVKVDTLAQPEAVSSVSVPEVSLLDTSDQGVPPGIAVTLMA
ncbi:hypothetical protein lerEdw1_000984 [Lerista edwardsae]|nr:hypothetical protein lerEdw1_000984 [Lerista edwardsae]